MTPLFALVGWLCYLTAAVIFWILFFSNALDPSFLTCALALLASGFALRNFGAARKTAVTVTTRKQ